MTKGPAVLMMTDSITLEHTVAAATGQIAADLGGELVILSLVNGDYFSLNPVAARIWELISEPRRVADIRDQLMADYTDIDSASCTRDLLEVLNHMRASDLIDTTGTEA